MKVFILESPNPMDLFYERREATSLEKICKLFGHQVYSFLIKSRKELDETLEYISSLDQQHDEDKKIKPLCIHFSCHGNKKGLGIGNKLIKWSDLYISINKLFSMVTNYKSDRILVFSSCASSSQNLTDDIKKHLTFSDFHIPKYIFTTGGDSISWDDAVVCWTIFYRKISELKLDRREDFQNLLDDIYNLNLAEIVYFRWDKKTKKYRRYAPSKH